MGIGLWPEIADKTRQTCARHRRVFPGSRGANRLQREGTRRRLPPQTRMQRQTRRCSATALELEECRRASTKRRQAAESGRAGLPTMVPQSGQSSWDNSTLNPEETRQPLKARILLPESGLRRISPHVQMAVAGRPPPSRGRAKQCRLPERRISRESVLE